MFVGKQTLHSILIINKGIDGSVGIQLSKDLKHTLRSPSLHQIIMYQRYFHMYFIQPCYLLLLVSVNQELSLFISAHFLSSFPALLRFRHHCTTCFKSKTEQAMQNRQQQCAQNRNAKSTNRKSFNYFCKQHKEQTIEYKRK